MIYRKYIETTNEKEGYLYKGYTARARSEVKHSVLQSSSNTIVPSCLSFAPDEVFISAGGRTPAGADALKELV